MNYELLVSITGLINVVACLVIIIIVIMQSTSRRQYSKLLFILLGTILFLLIWQINSSIDLKQFIILLALLTVLLQNLVNAQKLSGNQPAVDTSVIIAQSKEQERSRIYANLHDDVGAKLLELVYRAEDEKTKRLAKEVLNNMRQAVASTVNIQCTIQQLCDELISESQMRLKAVNIDFTYETKLDNPNHKLSTTVPSVITRIIREGLSNVIKHAQSDCVKLSITSIVNRLQIDLSDDGIGFDNNDNQGKGLKTINKRADSISAEVKWRTESDQGTTFTLMYDYANK